MRVKKLALFKYDIKFEHICRENFHMNFKQKRDELFRPFIKKLGLKNYYDSKIRLKSAIGLGLCFKHDSIYIRTKTLSWEN